MLDLTKRLVRRALAKINGRNRDKRDLYSALYTADPPLAPDVQAGWKMYPLFKGLARNNIKLSCHISVLIKDHCPHPPHTHKEEELLLLLSGEVELDLPGLNGDHHKRLQAGQFVYYPAFFAHTLTTTSQEPANYLMFKWSRPNYSSTDALPFELYRPTAPSKSRVKKNGFYSTRLFEGETRHLDKLHCHVTTLAPGGGYNMHTDAHDVAIVLLQGACETMGHRCKPTSVIYYSAGQPHDMRNPGDNDAYYLVFEFHGGYRPGWREKLMRTDHPFVEHRIS